MKSHQMAKDFQVVSFFARIFHLSQGMLQHFRKSFVVPTNRNEKYKQWTVETHKGFPESQSDTNLDEVVGHRLLRSWHTVQMNSKIKDFSTYNIL